jgi:hypothetical protein
MKARIEFVGDFEDVKKMAGILKGLANETNQLIKQDHGEIKSNLLEGFSLRGERRGVLEAEHPAVERRSHPGQKRGPENARFAPHQHRPKLVVLDGPRTANG